MKSPNVAGIWSIAVSVCFCQYSIALGDPPFVAFSQPAPVSFDELFARERHAREDPISPVERATELVSIAHGYYRGGDFGKSLVLFSEAQQTRDVPDKLQIECARMIGQINLFGKRDLARAEQAYEDMLRRINLSTDQDVVRDKAALLGEGYEKAAIAYQAQGKYDKSTEMRSAMLDKGQVSSGRRRVALVENARDFMRARQYSDALSYYDRLLMQYPEFGSDDGSIVNLRLERVEAYGLDRNDPKRIDLLQAIWHDPAVAQYPQMLNVGRAIVGLAELLGMSNVVESAAREWLDRYRTLGPSLSSEDKTRLGVDTAYGQIIVSLAAALEERGDIAGAVAAYEQLLAEFPKGPFSDFAVTARRRLYRERLKYNPDDTIGNIERGSAHLATTTRGVTSRPAPFATSHRAMSTTNPGRASARPHSTVVAGVLLLAVAGGAGAWYSRRHTHARRSRS